MQKNNYLFVLDEQKSVTFAENLKLKDMEKNNIIDFNMMYHGKIVKYVPENTDIFGDLMSNDADVLKKAMNYVYHRAKHMTYIGNNK